MKNMNRTRMLLVKVSPDEKARIDKLAAAEGCNKSELVRRALVAYKTKAVRIVTLGGGPVQLTIPRELISALTRDKVGT
jgi:hypothetical protein